MATSRANTHIKTILARTSVNASNTSAATMIPTTSFPSTAITSSVVFITKRFEKAVQLARCTMAYLPIAFRLIRSSHLINATRLLAPKGPFTQSTATLSAPASAARCAASSANQAWCTTHSRISVLRLTSFQRDTSVALLRRLRRRVRGQPSLHYVWKAQSDRSPVARLKSALMDFSGKCIALLD